MTKPDQKPLQEWLSENKRLFAAAKEEQCRAVLTAGTAFTKLVTALPEHEKALRIIEAMFSKCEGNARCIFEEEAERIINEK